MTQQFSNLKLTQKTKQLKKKSIQMKAENQEVCGLSDRKNHQKPTLQQKIF